jgi:HSP20 family protein
MAWRDYRDLLRQMETDMHRFIEETGFIDPSLSMSRFWQPAADVHDTEAGMVIKLELAGVTVHDVHVSLSGDGRTLSVGGVRSEHGEERSRRISCHQLEIYFGPFERTFSLPHDMEVERDNITATLKDGFLTITLPRRQPALTQTRSIPIEVVEEQ